MKKIYEKTFSRKSFVILIVFSAFILGPTISAQMIKPSAGVGMDAMLPSKYILNNDKSIYKLLIIAPKNFVKTLQPLVIHKNSVGISTRLITLTELYDQMYWQGRDEAEKIKYFIKTAIEEWGIKYVLLVGNFRKMPIRYVYNDEPWEHFPEPYFISELYYADIYDENGDFSSWDTNNNGMYGEWKGEEAQDKNIDLYPDVYVGRLACRNRLEVRIMVKKIIKYETTTYGSDWFNKILAIAGDTYPPESYPFPTPEFEGEENAKTVISYMPDFDSTTLFTSDGTLTGWRDVVREINSGYGFLFFDGHANPISWSTHPPNDKGNWTDGLSIFTMAFLKNKNMLPVCVVGGCHNLQFDTNMFNLLRNFKEARWYGIWTPECWGWKLTRMIRGGSIATIGNTGLGMTKEDKESLEGASDFLDSQFFYEYGMNGTEILGEVWGKAIQFFYEYGMNGTEILGEVWGKAISNYLNEYPIDWDTPAAWDYAIDAKTVQQWTLFGDPSLKIGGYSR